MIKVLFFPFMIFYCFYFEWVKKKYSCCTCKSTPRTSSLPPSPSLSPPPCLPPLLSLTETFEKNRLTAWGLSACNSSFYCNSCKVVLQQREIVKRLPWCTHIASYYMLFSRRKLELLIQLVKVTIFIKYFGVAQIVSCITAKCSNMTWPVIPDQCCSS